MAVDQFAPSHGRVESQIVNAKPTFPIMFQAAGQAGKACRPLTDAVGYELTGRRARPDVSTR